MDTQSLDALTIVVTHEIGPLIKNLRRTIAEKEASIQDLESLLSQETAGWNWEVIQISDWGRALKSLNDREIQCPCVSCAFLGSGYHIGHNEGLDHEIQKARSNCIFKNQLKQRLDDFDAKTDGLSSFLFEWDPNSTDFVKWTSSLDEYLLDSVQFKAYVALEHSFTWPVGRHDYIGEFLESNEFRSMNGPS